MIAILVLFALALVLVVYFACSRKREYLADASAARFTRYPEGLASALEKISADHARAGKRKTLRALAPLYIVNPLQATGASRGLMSTHPPTAERVRILRAMGSHAGWQDYEQAYRAVTGRTASCLAARTLQSEGSVPARPPEPRETRLTDVDGPALARELEVRLP